MKKTSYGFGQYDFFERFYFKRQISKKRGKKGQKNWSFFSRLIDHNGDSILIIKFEKFYPSHVADTGHFMAPYYAKRSLVHQ